MSWVAVGVAGVGLVGASMSADAAGDAAQGQQEASAQSNALQRYMYDRNNELAAPALNRGNLAGDRAAYLLGLSPNGTSGTVNGQPRATADTLRQELLSQYTRSVNPTTGQPQFATGQAAIDALGPAGAQAYFANRSNPANGEGATAPGYGVGYWNPTGVTESGQQSEWVTGQAGPTSTIDETGLNAEIQRRLAEQEATIKAQQDAARADPAYGSLAQQFQFNTYTPGTYDAPDPYTANTFSYTGEDLYNDPSYQFRLQQGQKQLDRQGAAAGRFLSGGQLQAASNYNQDAASQEFQNAYARAAGTFNTNETNRYNAYATNTANGLNEFNVNENNRANAFNTNESNRYNAFNSNFTNTLNPLLALSGAGQVASQQMQANNNQLAGTVSANLMSNANAQGAAGISQANAYNNALGQGVNAYQTNSLLNRFGGSLNNNPGGTTGISAANQGVFDSFLQGNNYYSGVQV